MVSRFNHLVCAALLAVVAHAANAAPLDRGLIAMPRGDGSIYLGWRFLQKDPAGIAFNVYRESGDTEPIRLNEAPLRAGSNFVDTAPPRDVALTYRLREVALPRGRPPVEGAELAEITVPAAAESRTFLSIPLQGDYGFQRVGIGDLNGDGAVDYVIKQPDGGLDPGSARPSPDTYKIEAYSSDGTFLWRRDLGWNMNMGIWWTPFIVADLDGDGRAEVALKTAPYADSYESSLAEKEGPARGFVISGPEYVSVLNGMTGETIDQADWVERGNPEDWGDNRGNRVNRNQIGLARLDGERISLLVCRGTYTRMVVDAYDLVAGKLVRRWRWDGDESEPPIRGQGSHGMQVADLDDDGREEIILGSVALDDDGSTLWNLGMGHNDIGYLTDIIPTRPGFELALAYETRQEVNGICVVDARSGEIIWGHPYKTTHLHDQGLLGDIVPDRPGLEFYAAEQDRTGHWLYSAATGELIDDQDIGGLSPRAVFWTGDLTKVLIPEVPWSQRTGRHANRIVTYSGEPLGEIHGHIVAIGDLVGDWREEIVTSYDGELRIYTTTLPASRRRVCLLEDPLYRNGVTLQSMGYLYPPQTSYHFR